MLRLLTVENLLLIERAELELGPGLNAITGETGAGKTLLATGLGLLLGDRSRSGLVRPGADEAWVEGVFDRPEGLPEHLEGLIPDDAEELILSRRVWPDGRSRAQVCGRTATVSDLRELAGEMISFHGQHEHRRLALSDFQLESLDSACGPAQSERRSAAKRAHEAVLEASTHLERLSGGGSGGRRELDLLRWELDEIESVSPDADELAALTEERDRLASADRIRHALEALLDSLAPEYGDHGVRDSIAAGAKAFESLPGGGAGLGGIPERLAALGVELDDLGAAAREQLEGLDSSPERLDEIEGRLESLSHLERKYGGSIVAVLAHAEQCRTRIAEMEDLDGAIERAEAELDSARDRLEAICDEISTARHKTAGPLAAAVEEALGELALDGARFEIAIGRREQPGPTGYDRVDFMVAPNAGIGPAPLGETASGGEISRVLLALLSVAYSGEGGFGRLLVFDEIDAGIGGRTAVAVGSRLSRIAEGSQVLCITHLAPVAARADRHFTIEKRQGDGVAETVVEGLDGERLIAEMVRMLGASEGDRAARAHAVELLSGAGRSDAA